jgi:hypothetical protein
MLEFILIGVLINIGGIPRGQLSFYYIGTGFIFLVFGFLITLLLGYEFIDVLLLRYASPSAVIPLSIGYPAISVGLIGGIYTLYVKYLSRGKSGEQ